jgi:hypothetical protein
MRAGLKAESTDLMFVGEESLVVKEALVVR